MSARRLILIPTEIEASLVRSDVQRLRASGDIVELCGFGPIVAAARTMQAIAKHRPDALVLLGIAGALTEGVLVAEAYEFSEVVCYGVGVGVGSAFHSAASLGWKQWEGEQHSSSNDASGLSRDIPDQLPLAASKSAALQLLTCCAASASSEDVRSRCQNFPKAAAEDMEGFGVAAAAQLSNVSLRIIRGISNIAGQRNSGDWKIAEAMKSAVRLLDATL